MGYLTGYKPSKRMMTKYNRYLLTNETSEIKALKLAYSSLKKAQMDILSKLPEGALQRIKTASEHIERVAQAIEQDERNVALINKAVSNNYSRR